MASEKRQTWGHAVPRPSIDELLASRNQLKTMRVECVKVDLKTALTFAKIARQTHDDLRRKRICRAARKAYETVVNLVQKVEVTEDDRGELNRGLAQLQSELRALGESF